MTLKLCICYDMLVAEVTIVESEDECKSSDEDVICEVSELEADVG